MPFATCIFLSSFFVRRLTTARLHEILDELDDGELENEEADVFLIPPDPGEESDEYSGDEEDPVVDLNHLPRRLLTAQVEFGGEEYAEEAEPSTSDRSGRPPTRSNGSGRPQVRSRSAPPKKIPEEWVKKKTSSRGQNIFPERNTIKYADLSPFELFSLFFDEEMIEMIRNESNFYARKMNDIDLAASKDDILVFLAILLLSGYNILPRFDMYWDQNEDVGNRAVQKAMRRNRFRDLKRFIHFEREVDKGDRYSKVRKVASKLQKSFLEHYQPGRYLSHDESMIKYFGKSSLKQSLRMKPIRFGYKVWSMNDPLGYLAAYELYQGANFGTEEGIYDAVGKTSGTVLHLIDQISAQDHCANLPFHVMCDNLFTSPALFRALIDRNMEATGTVRQNRIKDPLSSKEAFNKKPRGHTESAETKDGSLLLTKWKDNQVVSVLSTVFGVTPLDNASRWSSADKKKIRVPRPAAIREYNAEMGGTDRFNQNLNKYRVSIAGKKYYWSIFTWLLDAAVTNAWTLHRMASGNNIMDQLKFRRDLVMFILTSFGKPPISPGPSVPARRLGNEARFQGRNHFPRKFEGEQRRRCQNQLCARRGADGRGPKSRYGCSRCEVGLCIDNCFEQYHTVQSN